MARPRTPVGTFGTIELTKMADDVYRARTRVRDDDGKVRRVQANGETRTAAERNLKVKLSKRASRSFGLMDLNADSSFTQLVDVWLEDLDLEDDIAINTRQLAATPVPLSGADEFTGSCLPPSEPRVARRTQAHRSESGPPRAGLPVVAGV